MAQSILKAIEKNFPEMAIREGVLFKPDSTAAAWSGTHAMIGDRPAFDSYAYEWDIDEEQYVMGVHRELHEFVEERGYYWEPLDSETYFLYKI